MATVGVKGLSS